jgi:hypothetical protein
MFACMKQQLQAEIQLGRPWRFDAVLMAVLLDHEEKVGRWLKFLRNLEPARNNITEGVNGVMRANFEKNK